MTQTAAQSEAGVGASLQQFGKDAMAGMSVAITLLPSCMAAGVIAFGALGQEMASMGILLAFVALILGGTVTALFSTSSFIVTFPLPSLAAVQGSFILFLSTHLAFAGKPSMILAAFSLAIVLSGAFIALIGISGFARIIKFTPHPVMAGFKNGIALTLLWSQLKPFFDMSFSQADRLLFIANPVQLLAMLALTAAMFAMDAWIKKLPAALLGILLGTGIYLLTKMHFPSIELGRTVGTLSLPIPPPVPLLQQDVSTTASAVASVLPALLQFSAVFALLATLQSLLGYRFAQNLADVPVKPSRDLVALGAGTAAGGLLGGLSICAATNQSAVAYRSGGRTRAVALTVSLLLLVLTVATPHVLSQIPLLAISAVVIHTALNGFDAWSIALGRRVIRHAGAETNRRDVFDLLIVVAVMLVTAGIAVLPGVGIGIALACLVFIVNMSRPVIQRYTDGTSAVSKRIRSQADASYLRTKGDRRVILELNGVLFFGNADTLADEVGRVLERADMVLLDCRGVTDMDASGAAIMKTLLERVRKAKKRVLFCNVPAPLAAPFSLLVQQGGQQTPFADLDTALEWMEEQALAAVARDDSTGVSIRLEHHEFVKGLSPTQLQLVEGLVAPRSFPAASTLCRQGEEGDRMWLIMKGSVSVRITTSDSRGSRRVASIAQGTTVGEMSLIENAARSATIVANEQVETLELSRDAYRVLLENHPDVAAALFGNLLRELAMRIRYNHEDLRASVS